MDYADGALPAPDRQEVEQHLAGCNDCNKQQQEFSQLIHYLQQDSTFEPPAGLVQWGEELFQPLLQAPKAGRIRRIIAALVHDTLDQPMLAGVRRAGIRPPRQLVFRAGDVDVDVRIETTEANNRISLVGQVLSNTERFFDNTPVKLESHGVVRYKTVTNPVGEFSFEELPKDTYHLSVDVPEGQITLFCVHRGDS
jgi:hypothetical protein